MPKCLVNNYFLLSSAYPASPPKGLAPRSFMRLSAHKIRARFGARNPQKVITHQILILAITLAGVFYGASAKADTISFFVDSSYDLQGRERINATLRHESVNTYWYISDQHWSNLETFQQANLVSGIKNLSDEFDNIIYPKLRALFGSENNPGVDTDPKITILISEMIKDAGGYFREQDGFARERVSSSNQREMVYLNALHIDNARARSFLAHEFQHLITFNQKTIKHSAQEEVWLNELRSEIASTILGYDAPAVYGGSNLEARARIFLETPSDAILEWKNESADYASINLFGQYILDHYGRSFIAAMIGNDKIGIKSFNEALATFGFSENFSDVYTNWTIASLVNNCSLKPVYVYCYKNPALDYENFHIVFGRPEASGKTIGSQTFTSDWRAEWLKLQKNLEAVKPLDHIFKLEFSSPKDSKFRVPYVVYGEDGKSILEINEMKLDRGSGEFFVENFGYTVPQIVIIPSNQNYSVGATEATGPAPQTYYNFTATTINDTSPQSSSSTAGLILIRDGDLIRAEGDYKVYIINNGYKRWIQSADIFNFYGHLNFSVVQVVSPEILNSYKDSWLVRADGDKKVYEINGDGTRHWLDMTPENFSATGRLWDMVYIINQSELLWYRDGASVK